MIPAEKTLDECKELLKQRGEQYGDAEELYERTAHLWTAFLGTHLYGKDVCILMSIMKLARLDKDAGPDVRKDTYQDAINYIALAESLDK
jgi:hypothetical protein